MKFISFLLLICLISSSSSAQDSIPEFATILSKYVQFPTVQYKEKPGGMYFLKECEKKGLIAEILTSEDTAFNFVASLYPLSMNKPNIVFMNHMDVVPPGDSAKWRFPPYEGKIDKEIIWGRGSIDNKGMAVAQLFAVSKFVKLSKEKELPFNVSILCVSGEETDGVTGAKQITERFLNKLNPVLVMGEGGSGVNNVIQADSNKIVFGVSTVEKSKLILKLDLNIAASGHGSVPPKEYAMKELIFALEKLLKQKPRIEYDKTSVKALKTLGEHEKGIRKFMQKHFTVIFFKPFVKKSIKNDPILLSFFSNTASLTNIILPEGTDNMISNHASAVFDCRLLPATNQERYIRRIKRYVKDNRITFSVVSYVSGGTITNEPEIFSKMESAIKTVYPESVVVEMVFPATTDNGFFRNKGIPSFGIFPAAFTETDLATIHNTDENIHFSSMDSAIKVYKVFLDNILEIQTEKPK